MIDHTTENQTPKPADPSEATGGRWSASGDPIDTTEFDKAISDAEKAYKARTNDPAAITAAAEAYFKRGFALTEARQYASAIGDYRRALKIDPNHEDSKKWEQQIIGIYGMMKKEYPKPGEEPPPLPYKKS
jgi:tetratricopeptide (TPR) repeat protein